MNKKRLLFLNDIQFGYHTDYTNWCNYLTSEYDITYMAFDMNMPIIKLAGVTQVFVPFNKSFIRSLITYLKLANKYIHESHYDSIIISASKFAPALKLLTQKRPVIYDIRTVAVNNNRAKRMALDFLFWTGTKLYKHCTIITPHIAHQYHISTSKYDIVPLGANIIADNNKTFEELRLLYIGVIRCGFEESIIGFAEYHKDHPLSTYTIVGFNADGSADINEMISKLNLSDCVHFLGRKSHDECRDIFKTCNVGVSYIPMTKYFDYQPPTKNYEYMLSGMVCIATSTKANKMHITPDNGVLIEDNAASFTEGLYQIYNNRKLYDSEKIRQDQLSHTWQNIVQNILKPILNKIR